MASRIPDVFARLLSVKHNICRSRDRCIRNDCRPLFHNRLWKSGA